jgi:hypothetical protein
MLAFRVQGWEIVVSDVSDALLRTLRTRSRRIIPVGDGRYTLELPLEPSADHHVAELVAGGATLVSVNPIRQTLEDFFVQQVSPHTATADLRLESRR